MIAPTHAEELAPLHRHDRTGRTLGSQVFVRKIRMLVGRDIQRKSTAEKPKREDISMASPDYRMNGE